MSTLVDLLPHEIPSAATESPIATAWPDASPASPELWSLESFAREQIHALTRQLFTGSASLRQVTFSAVDAETEAEVLPVCLQVGEALALHDSGTVCVVEAPARGHGERVISEKASGGSSAPKYAGTLRQQSEQLSRGLWFMPADVFWGSHHGLSLVWLRARLAELRLEFDYTVLEGPAAGQGEVATLGSLSDGLVLVLQANVTRRATAQRVKEKLSSTKTRLLGAVLTGRTFPIPEVLYRRL